MNNKLFFLAKNISKRLQRVIPQSVRHAVKEKMIEKNIDTFFAEKQVYQPEVYPVGVNLIGSIRAEMGLGQSCRLVARQLEQSHYDFSIYNINFNGELREKDHTYDSYISETLPYGVNLFHVNPCELGKVFMMMPEAWSGRYNIAFWLWELEEFPDEWVKYCQLFDEIWTPSEFAGRGVKKKTNIPVKTVPYSVIAPFNECYTRAEFGLPEDKFLYLIMYDSNSTSGRKNPQGALSAYKKAFPKECEDVGLVIKVNNAKPLDIEQLEKELEGYKNVYFITDVLEKDKVNSLIRCVDVFVSLHRAEGFGLVMAEAMLLGTPPVATNWSSNVEFMSEEACCMVGYKLIANGKAEGLYPKGCIWAEPDVDEAAGYLRKLKEDTLFYQSKVETGRQCVLERLNEDALRRLWNHHFETVFGSKTSGRVK